MALRRTAHDRDIDEPILGGSSHVYRDDTGASIARGRFATGLGLVSSGLVGVLGLVKLWPALCGPLGGGVGEGGVARARRRAGRARERLPSP
jgi:hypothetical protein